MKILFLSLFALVACLMVSAVFAFTSPPAQSGGFPVASQAQTVSLDAVMAPVTAATTMNAMQVDRMPGAITVAPLLKTELTAQTECRGCRIAQHVGLTEHQMPSGAKKGGAGSKKPPKKYIQVT